MKVKELISIKISIILLNWVKKLLSKSDIPLEVLLQQSKTPYDRLIPTEVYGIVYKVQHFPTGNTYIGARPFNDNSNDGTLTQKQLFDELKSDHQPSEFGIELLHYCYSPEELDFMETKCLYEQHSMSTKFNLN